MLQNNKERIEKRREREREREQDQNQDQGPILQNFFTGIHC